MEPMYKIRFGGVPVTKEVSGHVGDGALICGDVTVRLEEFVQNEKRGGPVKHQTSFRKMSTRFP